MIAQRCLFSFVLFLFLLLLAGCSSGSASEGTPCTPTGISLAIPLDNFSSMTGAFIPAPYGFNDAAHQPSGHSGVDFFSLTQLNVLAPGAGVIRGIVSADIGQGIQLDLETGNCSVRLVHVENISVADGQRVAAGDVVATMGTHTNGKFFFHYELTALEASLTHGGGNTAYSICPFLHSSSAALSTVDATLAANAADVRTDWTLRADPLYQALGSSSNAIGYCYALASDGLAGRTYPAR